MKIRLLILLVMLLVINGYSQTSNVIFFTEYGEKFSVYMNNELKNASPQANVKLSDINVINFKIQIVLEDAAKTTLDKNMVLTQGTEATYIIKKSKTGEYSIKFQSEAAIAKPAQAAATPPVVKPAETKTVTTTKTTTSGNIPSGMDSLLKSSGININMIDPKTGMAVVVNQTDSGISATVNGKKVDQVYSTTTSSSTITTTKTEIQGEVKKTTPVVTDSISKLRAFELEGYTGRKGCKFPMNVNDFATAKKIIISKDFEDSRLTEAKELLNTGCLLTSQVKELLLLFEDEVNRLDLAKYCYGRTYDIDNYTKLEDVFKLPESIVKLNEYKIKYVW